MAFASCRNVGQILSVRFFGNQPEVPANSVLNGIFRYGADYVVVYVPDNASWASALAAGKWQEATIKSLAEHSPAHTEFTFEARDAYSYKVTGISGTLQEGAVLVIPSEYNGKPVICIGDSAFKDKNRVSAIVLPETITEIKGNAFSGLGITSIAFPASLETISSTALDGCAYLQTVTFEGKRPILSDSFYEDSPWELTTYVSWEKDYANWSTAVASGTWCSRPIAWLTPVEGAWARGVAVYRDDLDPQTLIFYGDGADHTAEGKVFPVINAENVDASSSYNMPWSANCAASVQRVAFDASFANCRPKHCAKWFRNFALLESVEGLEYLDVSEATSLGQMFKVCTTLAELDLSGFDTSAVTDMTGMFQNCTALTTIIASGDFDTSALSDPSQALFTGCTALAGGNGFAYDASKVSAAYATINTSEVEGYFSRAPKAVAVHDSSANSLTFYYDSVDRSVHGSNETVYNLDDAEKGGAMPWAEKYFATVEFDSSFAAYKPKSCANWFADSGVKTFSGIANLDVSAATDLSGMFSNCTQLVTLDLANFTTLCVTNMTDMFYDCSALTTIYAGNGFRTDALESTDQVLFTGCEELVGGAGFGYDPMMVSAEYARIDTGSVNGYFTDPATPRAVAVFDSDAGSLTFYYDALDHEGEDCTVYSLALCTASSNPPWYGKRASVTEVEFDESFAAYRPTTCYGWFRNFAALESFVGIENLNVSEATTLKMMFASCSKLTELDLSRFDTRKVTTMLDMFNNCSSLEKIYASTNFVTTVLTAPTENVFYKNTNLVGGKGTKYSSRAATYARIDEPSAGKAGYFTEKGLVAVAVVSSDGKTLSFYYDTADHSAEGTVYQISDASGTPPWSGAAGTVTNVVFARSFADYTPAHCASWFSGFANLEGVEGLANLNLANATSLNSMFANCAKLKELDFTGVSFGTGVTDFSNLFRGCAALASVDLAAFVTDNATTLARMFYGCSALTTLDLYSFSTASVSSMLNMFEGCGNLVTILVSGDFTASSTVQSQSVFSGCSSLVGGAGSACDGLTKVTGAYAKVDGGEGNVGYLTKKRVAQAVVSADGTTFSLYYDTLDHDDEASAKRFLVSAAEAQDPSEAAPWADDVASVARVVIDSSFADYRPAHCGNWFANFRNAETFAGLDCIDVSKATSLCQMFYACDKVKTLDLTTWNTPNLVDMAYMFKGALLEEIDVSSKFNALEVNPDQVVFLGCPKLSGEKGTEWSSSRTTARYARIDATGAAGLLSRKLQALAVQYGSGLSFYYDRNEHPKLDGVIYSIAEAEARDPSELMPWDATRGAVSAIVIDSSFANYRPKHCGNWFCNFTASLTGLTYLNVSEATSLQGMFYSFECETLDLSGFDTANVTDMTDMIGDADRLVTVYVSDKFVTTKLTGVQTLFRGCSRLTGGAGTTVGDSSTQNSTYARVDDPDNGNPGYFTLKPVGGYGIWVLERGLTGEDAAWDAKPAIWGGTWANAFIYTYGEGLASGVTTLMEISFDADGMPIITTAPVLDGRDDFSPMVIGAEDVNIWATPVELENNSGNDWTLPEGEEVNFFRVRMSN